jgi:hypothetical protein
LHRIICQFGLDILNISEKELEYDFVFVIEEILYKEKHNQQEVEQMTLTEEKRNLFDIPDKYYLAHCISSDYALGAGIAIEFQKRFKLRDTLVALGTGQYPNTICIGRVFNLVTKDRYWNKPTYETLKFTLEQMKGFCVDDDIKYLAMPKIGCGLDRLQWSRLREIIEDIFSDTDINIMVCSL